MATVRVEMRYFVAGREVQRWRGVQLPHVLTAPLLALSLGCATTTLTAEDDHPASPSADTAPLPPPPVALQPSFDPIRAYGISAPAGSSDDHHHGHGSHGGSSEAADPHADHGSEAEESPEAADKEKPKPKKHDHDAHGGH